jgi:hypothetical protein
MNLRTQLILATALTLLAATSPSQAQFIAYENLGTPATAGYSEPNVNRPVFGDSLNLLAGGTVSTVGLSLFNSSSGGNTGSILTGTTLLSFYDNTAPYGGGILALSNPLIGTAILSWDFTAGGGLPAGFYSTATFDLTPLSILVPPHILLTQQFTETTGTSTRNGVVLFSNPTIGTSPSTVYIKSTATAEGLYTFTGNAGQFGYHIELTLVPEPSSLALLGVGAAAMLIFRRRK